MTSNPKRILEILSDWAGEWDYPDDSADAFHDYLAIRELIRALQDGLLAGFAGDEMVVRHYRPLSGGAPYYKKGDKVNVQGVLVIPPTEYYPTLPGTILEYIGGFEREYKIRIEWGDKPINTVSEERLTPIDTGDE